MFLKQREQRNDVSPDRFRVALLLAALLACLHHGEFRVSRTCDAAAQEAAKPDMAKATPQKPADWVSSAKLSLNGLGPIKIGMTLDEARAAIGDPLKPEPSADKECFYVAPSGVPEGVSFMITDGRVSRIDISSPAYQSMSGARVGQTQDQVIQLYAGRLEVSPHKYVESGKYLTFIPKDKEDMQYRMIFETDGKKITEFRAGKLPEVEYVEGCS